MSTFHSTITWFEIPADDFDRAIAFYEAVLGVTLLRENYAADVRLAVFPYEKPGLSGCVVAGGPYRPAGDGSGPVVYLDCNGRLDQVISRIEPSGGRLAGPVVELPNGLGRFVHMFDPEGNRIGLHAMR